MATYTSKDLAAQRPTLEKLRVEYIAANKAAKLSGVHQRVRDLIQAPDLARVWRLAHGGTSTPSGSYNVQGATQKGMPKQGGNPYAAYYTPPARLGDPFTPNMDAINASVDMTLGVRFDRYIRNWSYATQRADHAIGIDEPWKLRGYTYLDEAGKSVTVKQTPAWMAIKMAILNELTHQIAGQQAAAQLFADAVQAQAPAWYKPALVYIATVTKFVPRVAISSAARNLTDDVKMAAGGLDKLKAAATRAATANQPTTGGGKAGTGTGPGAGQLPPAEEGKSTLLLVLGIAAAAAAAILLLGDEKAAA